MVLDRVVQVVDHVVGLDDLLGHVQVAVEERLGAGGDRLGRERAEPDQVAADLVELVLEGLAGFRLGARHTGVSVHRAIMAAAGGGRHRRSDGVGPQFARCSPHGRPDDGRGPSVAPPRHGMDIPSSPRCHPGDRAGQDGFLTLPDR